VRRQRRLLLHMLELAEDTDHLLTVSERNSAQFGSEALALGVQKHGSVVRSPRRSEEISSKDLPPAPSLLGGERRRHLLSPNIAHESLRGCVDPADHSVAVDDVCRN
jgi:hypothetical protein